MRWLEYLVGVLVKVDWLLLVLIGVLIDLIFYYFYLFFILKP